MLQPEMLAHIKANKLFQKTDRLLLAISGGADSMAMLHLLVSAGYNCEVAHVNFQLRGEDSNLDEQLVRECAKDLNVPVHIRRVATLAYANEHKISMEMAARDLRYAFFNELLEERNLDYVLVAHHKSDVVETFFINLIRGTGLKGLTGISEKSGRIIRPLLPFDREELVTYLEEQELPYRTDQSNFDTDILRNHIRHELIPSIETKKDRFKDVMQRSIVRLRESEKVIEAMLEQWVQQYVIRDAVVIKVPMPELYAFVSPSELLFFILQPLGFSSTIIDELASKDKLRTGASYYSAIHRLVIDRDFLLIEEFHVSKKEFLITTTDAFLQEPLAIAIESLENNADFVLSKEASSLCVDKAKLTFPLILRKWRQGDRFQPIGMGGKTKLLSDFFIDKKFSILEKEACWLLCSEEDIVWVVGHRMDERYKISDATTQIWKAQLA